MRGDSAFHSMRGDVRNISKNSTASGMSSRTQQQLVQPLLESICIDAASAYPENGHAPKAEEVEEKKYFCDKGHEMDLFTTVKPGYFCDVCMTKFPSGTPLHGCRICNFDKCQDCFEFKKLPDVVQFSAEIYYASEEEGCIDIEVIRAGPCECPSEVDWHTEDVSAYAGDQYVAASGHLYFGEDEVSQTVRVNLIQDDRYNSAKEFKLVLSKAIGCELGLYLYCCRVKVLDDDVFPSNRFSGMVDDSNIDRVSNVRLMTSFMWVCWELNGVKERSMVTLLIDQFGNVYYLLKTWLLIYMVDVVFAVNDTEGTDKRLLLPGQRYATVILCALLWMVPFVLLHVLDIVKMKLDVSARLRSFLQTAIYTKYLTYSDKARMKVEPAAVSLALLFQVQESVSKGYMKFWRLLALVTKLFIVICFMLKESPDAIWAVILFPTLMFLWIRKHSKQLEKLGEQIEQKEKDLMYNVQETCANYSLIADFRRRPAMQVDFQDCVENLNETQLPMEIAEVNNSYVPGWISTGSVFVYIVSIGRSVLKGNLRVGVFIAMVKILNELGEEFKEAYEMFMQMTEAVGPLKRLTVLLNGETDLASLKHDSELMRRQTLHDLLKITTEEHVRKLHRDSGHSEEGGHYALDVMRIEMKNLMFSYAEHLSAVSSTSDGGRSPRTPRGTWRIQVDHIELEQGSMVAIVSKHKSGQRTFMKLLSRTLLPSEGLVFIPSHLRVLHVSREAHLFDRGLLYNLTFGMNDVDHERVRYIVRKMHLHDDLQHQLAIELSDPNEAKAPQEAWRLKLSYTDKSWIHLARAFLVNAEVMILERPCFHFDETAGKRVIDLLQEHIANRGVGMDADTLRQRRPRTVLYSTSKRFAEAADKTWELSNQGGVTYLKEVPSSDPRKAHFGMHLLAMALMHHDPAEEKKVPESLFSSALMPVEEDERQSEATACPEILPELMPQLSIGAQSNETPFNETLQMGMLPMETHQLQLPPVEREELDILPMATEEMETEPMSETQSESSHSPQSQLVVPRRQLCAPRRITPRSLSVPTVPKHDVRGTMLASPRPPERLKVMSGGFTARVRINGLSSPNSRDRLLALCDSGTA